MLKVEVVECIHVALPTRRRHQWTGLTESIGGYLLVKVRGSDGTVGWGEAPVLKDWGGDFGRYFGETPGTTREVVDRYLAPTAMSGAAENIVSLHARMDLAIRGFPYAKGAVEMAVYDLVGRSLGIPVHVRLGGRARDRIPVTHSIGLLDMDAAVTECRQVVEEGIRTIKLKVGVDPERDVALVRQVREAVGDWTRASKSPFSVSSAGPKKGGLPSRSCATFGIEGAIGGSGHGRARAGARPWSEAAGVQPKTISSSVSVTSDNSSQPSSVTATMSLFCMPYPWPVR